MAIVALRHNDVTGPVPHEGFRGSTLPYGLDILFLGGFFVVSGMAMGRWLLERKVPVGVAMLSLAVAVVCGVMNYRICGDYHVEFIDAFIGNPVLFLLTAIGAILCFVAICKRLPDGRLIGWCGRLSLAIYAVHWIFVPFVDAPIYNYMLPLVQDVGLGSIGSELLLPDAGLLEPERLAGEALGSGILQDAGLGSVESSSVLVGLLQNTGLSLVGSTSASRFALQSLVPFLWRTLCGLVAFVLITLLTLPAVRVIEKWFPWMMGKRRVAAK